MTSQLNPSKQLIPPLTHSTNNNLSSKNRKPSQNSSQTKKNSTLRNWGNFEQSKDKNYKVDTPEHSRNRPYEKTEQASDIFAMISMKNSGRVRHSNQTRGSEQITTLHNSRKASKENFDLIDDEMLINEDISLKKNKKTEAQQQKKRTEKDKNVDSIKVSKLQSSEISSPSKESVKTTIFQKLSPTKKNSARFRDAQNLRYKSSGTSVLLESMRSTHLFNANYDLGHISNISLIPPVPAPPKPKVLFATSERTKPDPSKPKTLQLNPQTQQRNLTKFFPYNKNQPSMDTPVSNQSASLSRALNKNLVREVTESRKSIDDDWLKRVCPTIFKNGSHSQSFRYQQVQDYTDLMVDLTKQEDSAHNGYSYINTQFHQKQKSDKIRDQISYRTIYNNRLRNSQKELLANSSTMRSLDSQGRETIKPQLPNVRIKPLDQVMQAETQSQEKILDILKNTDYRQLLESATSQPKGPINVQLPQVSQCTCKHRTSRMRNSVITSPTSYTVEQLDESQTLGSKQRQKRKFLGLQENLKSRVSKSHLQSIRSSIQPQSKPGVFQIQLRPLKAKLLEEQEYLMQKKMEYIQERKLKMDKEEKVDDFMTVREILNKSLQVHPKKGKQIQLSLSIENDNQVDYKDQTAKKRLTRSQLSKQVFMFSPKAEKQMQAAEVDIENHSQLGSSVRTDSQIKLVNLQITSGTQTNYFPSSRTANQTKTLTMYNSRVRSNEYQPQATKESLPLKFTTLTNSEADETFLFGEDQEGIQFGQKKYSRQTVERED